MLEETLKRESVLKAREKRVSEREDKLGNNLYSQEPITSEASGKRDPSNSQESRMVSKKTKNKRVTE